MEMVTHIAYQAEDGTIFESEDECFIHEITQLGYDRMRFLDNAGRDLAFNGIDKTWELDRKLNVCKYIFVPYDVNVEKLHDVIYSYLGLGIPHSTGWSFFDEETEGFVGFGEVYEFASVFEL